MLSGCNLTKLGPRPYVRFYGGQSTCFERITGKVRCLHGGRSLRISVCKVHLDVELIGLGIIPLRRVPRMLFDSKRGC